MNSATQILRAALSSRSYAIISAQLADRSPAYNKFAHTLLRKKLSRATCIFAEISGEWNGVEESSFLILGMAPWKVADLAELFKQDAFIYSRRLFERRLSAWSNEPVHLSTLHAESISIYQSQPVGNFSRLTEGSSETFFKLNFS